MTSKKTIIVFGASILYLLLLCIFSQGEHLISNIVMAFSFMISIVYIYDYSQNLFSINNLIYIMLFGIGFFARYLITLINPDIFMSFAPRPLHPTNSYYLKTSFVILLFVVSFASAKHVNFRLLKGKSIVRVEEVSGWSQYTDIFESKWAAILFLITAAVGFGYRFTHIRIATEVNYGNLDTMFGLFVTMAQILAYGFLIQFSRNHRTRYLLLYLVYLIPTVVLSFLQAWKGTLLYESLIACIVFSEGIRKLKKRYIVLIVAVAFFVFPSISMLRDNMRYATGYNINVNSILEYNRNSNILEYYSNRLQYYDEAFYVVNTDAADIAAYRNEAKGIITRFFSGLIPRALWNDKPIVNSGRYITYTLMHYPSTVYNNLSVGFVGDAYASYGIIGVIIFGFFFSKGINYVEKMQASKRTSFHRAMYLSFGSIFFSYIEGDIAAKSISIVLLLISIAFIRSVLRPMKT